MTGTTPTVTKTYLAESVSTLAIGEALNAKATLRVTVASKVFTVTFTTVRIQDRLAQNFTISM
jgi:hypothetical protein